MKKTSVFLLIVLSSIFIKAQERLPTSVSLRDVDNNKVLARTF